MVPEAVRRGRRRTGIALVLPALLVVCACAPRGERVFVAPTPETVDARLEDGRLGARHLLILNHSTVPITVTSVTLTACRNVMTPCERHALDVVVEPNRRARVLTIEPVDPNRPPRVRYRWRWTYDTSLIPEPAEL